ncbi:MAG: nucleotidyltransferase family protein [Deltaproteobacteria bacterium]|nr:nucleotidyltransferase family protein [Deltaproteobacteria bacterium]
MKTPTAGILLAAGASTRFGEPKQLLTLAGRFLIEWSLAAALASNLEHVVLVLGCEHERIRRRLGPSTVHPKCEIIVNPDYRSGQSTSLRSGLFRIRHDFPSAMFLLGDQPLVDAAVINLLLERYAGSEKLICVPTHRGTRGNPTLFGSPIYPEILKLAGDKGARDIIAAHPDQVLAVEIPDPLVFLDLDRRQDVERIAALLESRPPLRKPPGT